MIKETLSNAIRSLSNKHEIRLNEVRIKISKKDDSLKYEILRNTDVLEETNLATALNLNTISSFMVGNYIMRSPQERIRRYGNNKNSIIF